MFFVFVILFSLLEGVSLASDGSQSFSYDLIANGKTIGKREITVRYMPASEFYPDGSRVIESWTEIDVSVAGLKQSYRNRATTHISKSKSNFISSISLNDDLLEIQGRQLSSGRWIVHEITKDGKRSTEYRFSEFQNYSLSLFDAEQIRNWPTVSGFNMLMIESGDLWLGNWSEGQEKEITVENNLIIGNELIYQSDKGTMTTVFSSDGVLLQWSTVILGINVEGKITHEPEAPDFGAIDGLPTFESVQEKEL